MSASLSFTVDLTDDQLQELAERVALILAERNADDAPRWLDSTAAAVYMGCKRSRVHDLVSLGRLIPHRDGRKLFFKRAELDAYLEASA